MKIALVCKKYMSGIGGLERYTISLSRELLRYGCEVHVFANQWEATPGIIYHHVPSIRLDSPGKNLSFAFFARKKLDKESFDVIHSMERIWCQDIYRASDGINPIQIRQCYPNQKRQKVMAMTPRRQVLSLLENRIFCKGGCRYVMTNSQLVKNQIVSYYNVTPEKVHVIYNWVDRNRFHPNLREKYRESVREKHNIGKDEIVLLFVGNNYKYKGLPLLLDAVALCQNPKLKLMVIGNDSSARYQHWVENNGMEGNVLFMGGQREIERYFTACDLFVLPTRYDAFANVCLEALSSAVPVITTRNNGAAEIIENGRHGYILERMNAQELARRIKSLEVETERLKMGRHAADLSEQFTIGAHMQQLLKLYDRISSEK